MCQEGAEEDLHPCSVDMETAFKYHTRVPSITFSSRLWLTLMFAGEAAAIPGYYQCVKHKEQTVHMAQVLEE